MDRDECWRVIGEQRRVLADLLDELAPGEWEAPSLCARWRVRDVAAHVAMTPLSPGMPTILAAALRHRGDFDRVNHDMAVGHAAAAPEELVAQLREHADDRRRPLITTRRNLLFDTLVHVQDVAVPLGRPRSMPPAAADDALDRVWTMGWPFRARRRLRGLRLTATDTGWAAGAGPAVTGPARALLLLLTGRTAAALPELTGPGTAALTEPARR